MRKIFLFLLLVLPLYLTASIYSLDKLYFLCPVKYQGDIVIRCDARGNGFFAAPRNSRRVHRGVDLFSDVGTPVFAARSGVVSVAKEEKMGMGKYVVIKHPEGMATLYGHLSDMYVSRGRFVKQGEIIGRVGKTGNAVSLAIQPHLHFEVRQDGILQDPLEYLS